MNTVTLSEDDALTILVTLWMLAATLDKTRQLLQQAAPHLPGELAIEATDRLADCAFIGGYVMSEN